MAQKTKGAPKTKVVEGANVDNLPPIGEDSQQTKGKVSTSFTLVDDSESIDAIEKESKNAIFAQVSDFLCPIKFDDSLLHQNMWPLVESGIISEDVYNAAVTKAKKEFFEENAELLEKFEKMSFAEIVAKLQENQTLYQKLLQVCNITELKESNYIIDGKVSIYRANQCEDKDGNKRYNDVTLSYTENNQTFTAGLFVERRDISTSNIILAIRYYSAKDDANRKLWRQIQDYRKILTLVSDTAQKAFANGFPLESVIAKVKESYESYLSLSAETK
jgi:hypothetical protein